MTLGELKPILEAHKLWAQGKSGGKRADLRGADLTGADLTGADLTGADLRRASLRGADLRGADLTGADLTGADLTGAVLTHADLRGVVLRGVVLTGVVLTGAVLTNAVLQNEFKVVGLVGSVDRSDGFRFLAWRTDNGDHVQAGCRFMTLDAYRAHITREYPDTDKARETLAILAYFETRFKDASK